MKDKKASISFYLVMLYMAIIVVVITAIIAPMGVRMGTEFYAAGDGILNKSRQTLRNIDDVTVRNHLNETIIDAQNNQELNIQVNADIYKYAWILLLGLVAIGLFLYSRRINEVRGFT